MKIAILSVSFLGVLVSAYFIITTFISLQTPSDWIRLAMLIILLMISIVGILLNFTGIKKYRNRVRFK